MIAYNSSRIAHNLNVGEKTFFERRLQLVGRTLRCFESNFQVTIPIGFYLFTLQDEKSGVGESHSIRRVEIAVLTNLQELRKSVRKRQLFKIEFVPEIQSHVQNRLRI